MGAHTRDRFCCRNSLLVFGLCLAAAGCAGVTDVNEPVATFAIDLRDAIGSGDFRPGDHTVGLRGSKEPLSWSSDLALSDSDGDSVYTATVAFLAPGYLDYKVKLGPDDAHPNGGWEQGLNRTLVLIDSATVHVTRAFGSEAPVLADSRSGTIERIEAFESAYGLADRPLEVLLPDGYADEDTTTYPVLYLHDGQNVFDQQAAGAEWGVDEAALRLMRDGRIPPVIVVAVGNTPNRIAEYTPVPGADGMGGDAAAYEALLTNEIMPFIEARYRVRTGPEHTAVGGSSLGGLVTLHLMAMRPDVFGSGLAVSPSVWWADLAILDTLPAPGPGRRLWVDVGTAEGPAMIQGARFLRDSLEEAAWVVGTDLAYAEVPHAAHSERAWADRVPDMLLFLYGSSAP